MAWRWRRLSRTTKVARIEPAASVRGGASSGCAARLRKLAHATSRHRRCAEATTGASTGPSTRTA